MSANRFSQQKLTVGKKLRIPLTGQASAAPFDQRSVVQKRDHLLPACRKRHQQPTATSQFVIRVFTALSNCRDPTTCDYRRPDPHSASHIR